ncbi:MAG: prephenate dehydrogenase/arogenate dehydrogenase family protein [Verrucomicrobiota bacterium]
MIFSKIAILGPGLLGGSIALALRRKCPDARIAVWARREEAVEEVRAAGIADLASTDLASVVKDAGLVIFCVPIGAMTSLAEKIAPLLAPGTLLTDVGSVKVPVVESLAPLFKQQTHFVGSHPMAGSEQTGLAAASAGLFDDAVCIITPDAASDAKAVEAIGQFWTLLGCRISSLSPAAHDEVIALVSHLPHLIAATIVNLVCSQNPNSLNFCGNGFRDTTRVASGSAEMWSEILQSNRESLKKSVEAMIEKLREVLELLDSGDETRMRQFLTEAKTERDRLKARK